MEKNNLGSSLGEKNKILPVNSEIKNLAQQLREKIKYSKKKSIWGLLESGAYEME